MSAGFSYNHQKSGGHRKVNELKKCWMWNIPLLAEEGWLRHQLKVCEATESGRRRARSASAIARSRNSGQLGEILRPEQFRRTSIEASPYRPRASRHPGRAVSERIHFCLWRVRPLLCEEGTESASSIRSHLHRPPLQSSGGEACTF